MNAIIGFLGRQGGFEECLEQEEPVAYQFYHSSKYPDTVGILDFSHPLNTFGLFRLSAPYYSAQANKKGTI